MLLFPSFAATAFLLAAFVIMRPDPLKADEVVYNLNDPEELTLMSSSDGGSSSSYYRVHFWTDINYTGNRYTLQMQHNRCYRISTAGNDLFSSVQTFGQCVNVYRRDNCYGAMARIEGNSGRCHRNLGDCDMNDAVSSVRLCRGQYYDDAQGGDSDKAARIRDLLQMILELQHNSD